MSTASISYVEFDPSNAAMKDNLKKIAEKGRANGHKFVTYAPVDHGDKAVTVILHDCNSSEAKGAELVEMHTRQDGKTGLSALAAGPKQGISSFHSRTAHVSHHGNASSVAKPYAIAFLVSYDPKKAADLKRAGHAINAHHPKFRFHVARRQGLPGHAIVLVPVDSLDELDNPVSAKAKPIVDIISKSVTNVSMFKLKRLPEYSW